jgi:peptidoglycan/LPS O-acetylase OafA/YrhL
MVWLGEISYEIFLLHVVVMAVLMNLVLRWSLFTGSLAGLYVTTLAVTIPWAWALHRVTGPTRVRNLYQLT